MAQRKNLETETLLKRKKLNEIWTIKKEDAQIDVETEKFSAFGKQCSELMKLGITGLDLCD